MKTVPRYELHCIYICVRVCVFSVRQLEIVTTHVTTSHVMSSVVKEFLPSHLAATDALSLSSIATIFVAAKPCTVSPSSDLLDPPSSLS